MKKSNMIYNAPQVDVYEIAAERGYGDSLTGGGAGAILPDFGSEGDDLIY